jgi:hypothetical protein
MRICELMMNDGVMIQIINLFVKVSLLKRRVNFVFFGDSGRRVVGSFAIDLAGIDGLAHRKKIKQNNTKV